MAKEIEYFETTGITLYAKPHPLVESPWGTDAVSLSESGTVSGYYSANVGSPSRQYTIFQQSGGSPANTDTPLGSVDWGVNLTHVEGAATIDTLSITSLLEVVLAFCAGATEVTGITGGKRLTVYKQDSSTEKLRIDFNSNGEWTATVVT